jgi:hypothetical protein
MTCNGSAIEKSASGVSDYELYAPIMELRWQSSDRPASVTATPTPSFNAGTANSSIPGSVEATRTASTAPVSNKPAASAAVAQLSTADKAAIGVVVPVVTLGAFLVGIGQNAAGSEGEARHRRLVPSIIVTKSGASKRSNIPRGMSRRRNILLNCMNLKRRRIRKR